MTKLYEANNHILIHTGYGSPGRHCHQAAHILISMGDNMCITADGTEYVCRGIMIPSGTVHRVDCCGNAVLVFLYDCTTDIAGQIRHTQSIAEECCQKITAAYSDFERECTSDNYDKFESYLRTLLGFSGSVPRVKDERILMAMQYIRSMCAEKLTCQQVADRVYLSQSRFSHLFREQVGMTFASYLIYQRIMYVYVQVIQGSGITEAALEAGFSGSSHFADTNRRVFGLPASTVTRDLTFIKLK